MRSLRALSAVVALVVGLVLVTASGAVAAPTTAVPAVRLPPTDPDPAAPPPVVNGGGSAEVGSVSEVAARQADAQSSTDQRSSQVGRYASPATKSAAIWDSHGRPDRLIIVRRTGIDSVSGGRLLRHVVRPVSVTTLRGLASAVPSSWLSIDGSTARLSATLVLSTGVTLSVAAPVDTLLLVGGAAAPDAASVFTGGGALAVRGVKVVSADPGTGAPMPVGPGRPYVLASASGRLDVSDSTVSDLGATAGPQTWAGVEFDAHSTGSIARTTLTGNTVGLRLAESEGVQLTDVTTAQSVTDGLVLFGDTGSALSGIRSVNNGKNGVSVVGRSSPRPITDVTAQGNHDFGVIVHGQVGPRFSDIVTSGDGAGGMEINHSTDVSVAGLTATDEPVGVYTHVSSARVTLQQVTVAGGRRGVVVEKTTTGLTLTDASVMDTEQGISLGGHQMKLDDVTLTNATTGTVIERGATDIDVERLTIQGGQNGLIANPGTTGVAVRELVASGVSDTALRASSPDEQIVGGHIDGSATAVDVQAPTTLTGVTIVGADTGVRVRTPANVHADQVDITAISVGINIADGTPFLLTGSRVHALESIRGTTAQQGRNDLSLPALSVLGAIGVPLLLLAVLLEGVALLRQRRWARRNRALLELDDAATVTADRDPVGSAR